MCMCVPAHPALFSHALPALLPLAIEPAPRTSRLLLSRRLRASPGLPPPRCTAASFGSDYLPPHRPFPFPAPTRARWRAPGQPEQPRARSAPRRERPVGSGSRGGAERRGGAAGRPEGGSEPCAAPGLTLRSGGRRGAGPARVPPVLPPACPPNSACSAPNHSQVSPPGRGARLSLEGTHRGPS
ncbi:uncharacterized protein LOC131080583 [Melospiza georgiana]|uniref:uncharacterized protein LOC131080583 n=1 Tax=Melospiza georgiana TaxID=44398 RepID=UPI0025AD3A77|nr:uncharacterized protein LOC131080583 [Melospiza georgiana]